MFRNSNQEVIKELARDNYISHKSRNRIAILAIALTTLLITAVWTVGISFISTISNYGESAPGPGCEGSISGTEETQEKLLQLPQIDWADMARECSFAALHNQEFAGMDVRLLAPDKAYFSHNFVDLIEGKFAENANEIVISDTMAKRLGLKQVVGSQLELLVMTGAKEEMAETKIKMLITGYYKNPLVNISEIYDEIYTSEDFIDQYNPVMKEEIQPIYVKLNNLNPLLLKTDVMNKLQDACDLSGGKGVGTKHTNNIGEMLFSVGPALLFVVFIILSGYFLIYNVFYISVSSDIRWFGMMKTIGTTAKQLKEVLMRQIRRLALLGILLGVVLGYLVGNLIGPKVMEQTIYGMFYTAPNIVVVLILGAGFSWFTVYASAVKSLKLACCISPVEAARFVPKKKKNLFTILSFTLSGMIFLVACNATLGFSVENMVKRYNMRDARIFHSAAEWSLEEPYQPISVDLPEQIRKLPFVTDVDVIYRARSMPDYEETGFGKNYLNSVTEVSLEGTLQTEMGVYGESEEFLQAYGKEELQQQAEQNRWKLSVVGISSDLIEQEMEYAGDYKGSLDVDKFAKGEGIIWISPDFLEIMDRDFEGSTQPGDVVKIGFYNNQGNYVQKEMTVMAVVTDSNMYGTNDFGNGNIILSDTLFQELYPDYEQRISNIQIKTKGEISREQHQQIHDLMAAEYSTQLNLESCYETRISMESQQRTFRLIGFLLAGLLGIIGVSNLINTITSDVFSRKIEFAAMQSIGMTRKQLFGMLLFDTGKFISISVVLMLFLGGIMSYLVTQSPLFTGFNGHIFLMTAAGLLLLVVGICVILTWILVRILNQKSVVERLREIE